MAVVIPIISEWNAKGLNKAMSDIQKAGSGFDKFAIGIEKASRTAAIGLVALSAAGFDAARAAADDAKEAAILATTLKNTTKATDKQVASVEDWITKQGQLFGITDSKLRPALGKLVTATGSVAKAQDLASLAMDISTARGTDLESTSQALAKAYSGNFTALKKLVPGISDAALKSKDWGTIQAELNRVVGGAAATAANTTAGKYQIMTNNMQEAKEAIGAGLLPVMEKLLPLLAGMAVYLQENGDQVAKLVLALSGFFAIIVSLNAVIKTVRTLTEAWKLSQMLLNAVMSANPLGLFAIAIATVIALLVYAYKHSDTFRNAINGLWESLKRVGSYIKDTLTGIFGGILSVIQSVIGWVDKLISKLDIVSKVKGFFGGGKSLSGTIGSTVSSTTTTTSTPQSVYMTDEMVARGIANILAKSDLRNGANLAWS